MKQYNEKTYQYFKEMQESRLDEDKQKKLLSKLLDTTRYDEEQKFHEIALKIWKTWKTTKGFTSEGETPETFIKGKERKRLNEDPE